LPPFRKLIAVGDTVKLYAVLRVLSHSPTMSEQTAIPFSTVAAWKPLPAAVTGARTKRITAS
jgi:hypothetical protein